METFHRSPRRLNRRRFLLNSAWAMAGCLLGFSRVPAAAARQMAQAAPNPPPRIALIIDDIGFSRSRARQFIQLNLPLTFSILPHLRYSRELALELQGGGYEIMLHQPMEPYNACCDPGPGALFVGDTAEVIGQTLKKNIGSMPCATGMNNHMGSRFTESPDEIREALMFIKTRGLFFIDSYTSSSSIAYATARECRLSAAYRHVFLDNIRSVPAILLQLEGLRQHALQFGRAIGIGHPYVETALAIGRFAKRVNRSGIALVTASQIISNA